MCNYIKTIGKVKSGELTVCLKCHHYHLTFNNIFLSLQKKNIFNLKNIFCI